MLFIRSKFIATAMAIAIALGACSTAPQQQGSKPVEIITPAKPADASKAVFKPVSFDALPGWRRDDLREAWPAFLTSCEVLVKRADWKEPCSVARDVDARSENAVRLFFEAFFIPHHVLKADGTDDGLITGYYEPLLRGARKRGGAFQTPLHRAPDDLLAIEMAGLYPELKGMRLRGRLVGNKIVPYPSRSEMGLNGSLAGKELLWVDDPIEAFFLQVQGSGRVQLVDTKETVRVAYADQNGHPYKSIGRYLVDKGEMTLDQASAQNIKAWYASNPARQQELLNANPSYVFFKEEKLNDSTRGPKGALGVPLTPQRSIAVDSQFIPLGVPVFLATSHPGNETLLQRLVMAQDTGGAIKGPTRADYFWGFAADAGEKAGKMKQRGTMWLLLPRLATQPVTLRPER
jgi:membrane-bound lytic murein transglycosylase A